MKIWLIQHGEPPPHIENHSLFRNSRLAKSLAKKGIKVTFWSTTLWHHQKRLIFDEDTEVLHDDYQVKYLHCGSYKKNISVARFFHHYRFAKKLKKQIKVFPNPDLIMVAHPIHGVAKIVIDFANKRNIPVILDLRDFWPDIFETIFPKFFKFLYKLFFFRDIIKTKKIFNKATALVGVMPQIVDWAIKFSGRTKNDQNKVFYIGGDSQQNSVKLDLNFIDKKAIEEKIIFNYMGSFTKLSHPKIIIEAANILKTKNEHHKFSFILCGNGDYFDECKNLALDNESVHFTGWLEKNEINNVNAISLGGIIPSIEKEIFPNKVFSYTSSGQIIISSSDGDLRKLIHDYNAGFYFNQSNVNELVDIFLKISSLSKNEAVSLSNNSKKLFNEHFQADNIYENFSKYLIKFIKN